MATKDKKNRSLKVSSREILPTRLYDDANLETRYESLNKLGEGSFGTVTRVKSKENDLFYAMKTITKKVMMFIGEDTSRQNQIIFYLAWQ